MKTRMKCVQEIHSEYITVGQEYTYVIDEEIGMVSFRKVDVSYCGSYMYLSDFKRHVKSGKIELIE